MIRSIGVAALCVGLLTGLAEAQTPADDVVSSYTTFKKLNIAAKFCVSEEGRMQLERNDHYDALLSASAKNPHAPTLEEMLAARAEIRLEDEALKQKREECEPLLDEVVAAAKELRRDCSAYTPITNDEETPPSETLATNICRAAKSDDGKQVRQSVTTNPMASPPPN